MESQTVTITTPEPIRGWYRYALFFYAGLWLSLSDEVTLVAVITNPDLTYRYTFRVN